MRKNRLSGSMQGRRKETSGTDNAVDSIPHALAHLLYFSADAWVHIPGVVPREVTLPERHNRGRADLTRSFTFSGIAWRR